MKVLIQRVSHASVVVDNETVGQIYKGILALIGIQKHDNQASIEAMVNKLLRYRIFPDDQGKMNLSVSDINGGVLAVSQFTLAADTQKGLRPSFSSAAAPEMAEELYEECVKQLKLKLDTVETGVFAADMKVSLLNDGPVTFLLEN